MPTIRSLLNQARELVITGDLVRARVLCEQVLARYPKHVEAHVLLGEAAREAGQFDDARRFFLAALAFDPENGIGYWALGLIAEQQGERELALSLLEHALEFLPGDADLWQAIRKIRGGRPEIGQGGLGRGYLRQGHFHRARRELEAALSDQPSRQDLRLALAECLWRMGLVSEARLRCDEVLEASPDCLKALLLLADCNRQQRRLAAAERLLRRAALVDPDGDLAAGLFVDADPAWIARDPVDLDADEVADEQPGEQPEPANWIEQLARLAESPRAAPEPRLSDWFAEPVDSEPIQAVEETLFDDETLAPWHDLLALELSVPPDIESRLSATLADLSEVSPDSDDGWRELILEAEAAPASEGAIAPEAEQSAPNPPPAANPEVPLLGRAGLERARQHEQDGDFDAALAGYLGLLGADEDLVPEVLERLRAMSDARPNDDGVHRALGDACILDGHFQRAVDEYYLAFTARLKNLSQSSRSGAPGGARSTALR